MKYVIKSAAGCFYDVQDGSWAAERRAATHFDIEKEARAIANLCYGHARAEVVPVQSNEQPFILSDFVTMRGIVAKSVKDGRAKSLALTKLDEAAMWIGLALDGRDVP